VTVPRQPDDLDAASGVLEGRSRGVGRYRERLGVLSPFRSGTVIFATAASALANGPMYQKPNASFHETTTQTLAVMAAALCDQSRYHLRMGRKPLGETAMTPAERQRRHRAIHKAWGQATAHRDFYLLAVHTHRLIKLLGRAGKKYPLSPLSKADGVPLPIKLELMKAPYELHHLLHALLTGEWSPERQAQFDDADDQRMDAERNRPPSRKELERRKKRDAKRAAAPRAATYLFPPTATASGRVAAS
jgi:hypothetical protein